MTALLIETARDLTARQAEELRRWKGERLNRQVLRVFVWNEDVLAGITSAIWKWVRETLEEEGFEGRELTEYCQLLLEGIDGSLSRYEQLLTWAAEAGLTPEAIGLSDLEVKLPALREARPKVVEILNLATRPPRPVDEAMLNKSKGAFERGEFVTINDEFLARLREGQDF